MFVEARASLMAGAILLNVVQLCASCVQHLLRLLPERRIVLANLLPERLPEHSAAGSLLENDQQMQCLSSQAAAAWCCVYGQQC